MLSDETLDKAPADLVSMYLAATAAIHGGIFPLRESLEFEESRAVPDVESIKNAVAGWQSIADRAADNCDGLARDLHEFGHYFVGVTSGTVSIAVPLGGPLNGGPVDSVHLEDADFDYEWNRVGTAPSWHHVALGVGRLFLVEIEAVLARFESVLRRHTGDDPNAASAFEITYHSIVGNESMLPLTLRWGESDLERLRLNLEQELLRAWGTWFPAGSEFTAFGDLPEEEQEQAKSGSKPPKDGRTPDQRNREVGAYLEEHGDRDKKITLKELAEELGCTIHAAHRTVAWKTYNTEWEERYGNCRTRSGKGRRPNVATDLTDEEVRRLAEEQAIDDSDKVGRYDRI